MQIEEIPSWIDQNTKLNKDNFKKIFIFFVILSPDPKKSARAVSLPESTKIPIKRYKGVKSASELDSLLDMYNLFTFPPKGDFEERAVFTRRDTDVLSFIDHIRNSIAHGRFNIIPIGKDDILIMEDIDRNKHCSARIIVNIKTLTKWINDMGFLIN